MHYPTVRIPHTTAFVTPALAILLPDTDTERDQLLVKTEVHFRCLSIHLLPCMKKEGRKCFI